MFSRFMSLYFTTRCGQFGGGDSHTSPSFQGAPNAKTYPDGQWSITDRQWFISNRFTARNYTSSHQHSVYVDHALAFGCNIIRCFVLCIEMSEKVDITFSFLTAFSSDRSHIFRRNCRETPILGGDGANGFKRQKPLWVHRLRAAFFYDFQNEKRLGGKFHRAFFVIMNKTTIPPQSSLRDRDPLKQLI